MDTGVSLIRFGTPLSRNVSPRKKPMNCSTVELSSGHIFAKGSVKAISPIQKTLCKPDDPDFYGDSFRAIGVGFIVNFHSDDLWEAPYKANTEKRNKFNELHKEAINKLLGDE